MNTAQLKPRLTKLKKFAVREVEELRTTAAAVYPCWLCGRYCYQ